VSHLAAAVGTPCLLLFGPTDPAMWAPPGDQVRVLRRGGSLEAITVDEVAALTFLFCPG
jgi:ADP-heptose:LPS heptosyltransferase